MRSQAAAMSPRRNGSCPGGSAARNARAAAGSTYPRRTRTAAVSSLMPSSRARRRTSLDGHGRIVQLPCIAGQRYEARRTEPDQLRGGAEPVTLGVERLEAAAGGSQERGELHVERRELGAQLEQLVVEPALLRALVRVHLRGRNRGAALRARHELGLEEGTEHDAGPTCPRRAWIRRALSRNARSWHVLLDRAPCVSGTQAGRRRT